MLQRMLPAFVLLLSACEGQPSIDGDSNGTANGERSISTYSNRDPIDSGATIIQWQAIDDTHVFILDSSRTLSYGDGVHFQAVQTSVLSFAVAPKSPNNASSPAIWIKDLQSNLYQWQLGWAPQQVQEEPIAYNVGSVKVSADGYPYWVQNGNLYGGVNRALIDGNVSDFFPNNSEWVMDIGTDGKLWSWDGATPWRRAYVDGNTIAAQPGCFDNPDGNCNSYVLGSDRKLWAESNAFGGHGSTPIDSNVLQFYGISRYIVLVEGLDHNLWREDASNGKRDAVDGNVYRFQPTSNVTVWVQGYDGKLWREHLGATLP